MSNQVERIVNKGIDRAVPFKKLEDLTRLRELGYTFVGRYLTRNRYHWKSLSRQEAEMISKAGMYVVCVFQDANNRNDYFSFTQGKRDACDALEAADRVGMPDNQVIYFSVDMNTSKGVSCRVIEYFEGIVSVLGETNHRIGVYGCYQTCVTIPKEVPEVTFKWQTVAWSKGRKCDFNLYQHKTDTFIPEDKKLTGYDLNISYGNGGGWQVKKGE